MSVEVVQRETGQVTVVGEGIDDWVQMLGAVGDLARQISQTPFVPDSLRGSTAGVAAAILTGRELGIGPMLALRHIHVIKGKPGQSAELMRLLVQRDGHDIEVVEATDTRAVMRGRRRGQESWHDAAFTADQARRAKIDLGGYPEDKLVARATTRLCRRMFADVIGGLPTTDELEDSDLDERAATEPSPTPAKRTAKRAARGVTTATRAERATAPVARAPEPDLDEAAPGAATEAATDQSPEWAQMHADVLAAAGLLGIGPEKMADDFSTRYAVAFEDASDEFMRMYLADLRDEHRAAGA